jgi:hypothetical protein
MRNVVPGLGISLDGYIARLDGAVGFLFMPKGLLDGGIHSPRSIPPSWEEKQSTPVSK